MEEMSSSVSGMRYSLLITWDTSITHSEISGAPDLIKTFSQPGKLLRVITNTAHRWHDA